MEIEADEARRRLPELTDLLVDAVDGGGANGFLRPLAPSDASAYWERRIDDIEAGRSILLGSLAADGALTGIVVLDLAGQQNGQHRAEVTKLMVHSSARRQGLGARLLAEAEDAARGGAAGCSCSTRFRAAMPSGSTAATAGSRSASSRTLRCFPTATRRRRSSSTSASADAVRAAAQLS